jgi:FAD/FMN-containing dehydrogenase
MPSQPPLSALELRDAVRGARPVDAARLDRILRVDEEHGLVEVQVGTTWKSIAERLRPGDARAEAASRFTLPTVGESIACNAAGPDGRPAIVHVESLTLVAPEGELRRVTRLAHKEMLALVVGGHNLFGTLYSITLRIDSLARAVDEATFLESLHPQAGLRRLQLLLPPESLAAFESDARRICGDWRVDIVRIDVRRTLAESESFLRWAQREYAQVNLRLAAWPTLGRGVRGTQLEQELIDAAIALGGSFALTPDAPATRAQVERCYPQLGEFLAEKRRIDPSERVSNAWYRHYRSLLERGTCEVRFGNA